PRSWAPARRRARRVGRARRLRAAPRNARRPAATARPVHGGRRGIPRCVAARRDGRGTEVSRQAPGGDHEIMTGRLAGKVALVTGAAGGQGAAEARLFAAEGARVAVTDVVES